MSKKDKNKFHRRLRAEILKQMEGQSKTPEVRTLESQETTPAPVARPSLPEKIKTPNVIPPVVTLPASDASTALVYNDLKKSALIIGSIIVLIIIIYFVDLKTDILLNISNIIFKGLHLAI